MTTPIRVVVLERVVPGVKPSYKTYGLTKCAALGCDAWVWLGEETLGPVQSGSMRASCLECAQKFIPPEAKFLHRFPRA